MGKPHYVGKTKKYKTAKKIEHFLEGFEPEDESWMKFILQCFDGIAYTFHNKEFQVPHLCISRVSHIWIKLVYCPTLMKQIVWILI